MNPLGSAKNAGLDFSISGQIIQKKDWSWMLTVNGGHVYDKIEKISNALQRTNSETTSSDEWNAPKIQFKEGKSLDECLPQLNDERWGEWNSSLSSFALNLKLPRFEM